MKTKFTPTPKEITKPVFKTEPKTTDPSAIVSFAKKTPESSSVASMEYNADSKTFTLHFKNGGTYDYLNVPEEVAEKCRNSSSVGALPRNELKGYEYKKRS